MWNWGKTCGSLDAIPSVTMGSCKSKTINSNSNWTFIALNLPKQEDSKAQQNKKQSTKFCVQGHNRGRTPRRTPGG